jgi:glycosyltransferase involved in cell wall biosynthesis
MRIVIFTPFLYPFHVDIAKVLADNVYLLILTCGVYGNYPFQKYLRYAKVLRCANVAGTKVLLPFSIFQLIRNKPHVVIIFGIESVAGIMIYFVAKLIKAKPVVVVEENNIHYPLLNSLLYKIKLAIIRCIYANSPLMLIESEASQKYVFNILRVNRTKPFILRVHGIDTVRFLKSQELPRDKARNIIANLAGIPRNIIEKKWWIAFIGEPSFSKGADILIDAINILYHQFPEVTKDVVFLFPNMPLLRDRPDLQLQYQRKLDELLLKGIVILYRPIYPEFMPLFYRAVDIVVLPSRLFTNMSSDRSPNVPMEALASGNIVVASYAGGIPSIVGDSGILIKPNDPQALSTSLKRILQNIDTYMYLKQKGRKRALYLFDTRYYVLHLLTYLKKIL